MNSLITGRKRNHASSRDAVSDVEKELQLKRQRIEQLENHIQEQQVHLSNVLQLNDIYLQACLSNTIIHGPELFKAVVEKHRVCPLCCRHTQQCRCGSPGHFVENCLHVLQPQYNCVNSIETLEAALMIRNPNRWWSALAAVKQFDVNDAEHHNARYKLMKIICNDVILASKTNDDWYIEASEIDVIREIFMMLHRAGFDFNMDVEWFDSNDLNDDPEDQQQILCFALVNCVSIALILLDIAKLQQHGHPSTSPTPIQSNFVRNAYYYKKTKKLEHCFVGLLNRIGDDYADGNMDTLVSCAVNMIPLLDDSVLFTKTNSGTKNSPFWDTFVLWCKFSKRNETLGFGIYQRIMKEFLNIVAKRADVVLQRKLRWMSTRAILTKLKDSTIRKTINKSISTIKRNRRYVKSMLDSIFPSVLILIVQKYA